MLSAFLRKLCRPFSNPQRRQRTRLQFDVLEGRCLPSTCIAWTNRGGPGGSGQDTDHFEEFFGPNAEAARAIVDTAIADWHAVIPDFGTIEYLPGKFAHLDVFNLKISAANLSNDLRGHSNNSTDFGGKPVSGWLELHDDPAENLWFYDQTPNVAGEFTTILNRFTASGNIAGNDMLACTLHEMGHIFGLGGGDRLTSFLTDVGPDPNPDDDNDGDAELYTYTPPGGASPVAAFTDSGGYHIYEGPEILPQIPASLLPSGLEGFPKGIDLMNDGRNIAPNARTLISDLDASILRDVYQYNVVLPSSLPQLSYMAQFDPGTGVLTVHGDPEQQNDIIFIGNGVQDTIDVNVNGYDMLFPSAPVVRIVVTQKMTQRDGDDTIIINLTNGNPIPDGSFLTVDAGKGTNELDFFGLPTSADYMLSTTFLQAGPYNITFKLDGIHRLAVQAPGDGNNIAVNDTPAGVPIVDVIGGPGKDMVDVQGMQGGTVLHVFAGPGDDQIFLSKEGQDLDQFAGHIVIDGGDGFDQVVAMDFYGFLGDYFLSEGVLQKQNLQTLYFQCEYLELNANGIYGGIILVDGTAPGTDVVVNLNSPDSHVVVDHSPGGPGHETVDLVRSNLSIHGVFGGNNVLTLRDDMDATGDRVTVTASSIGAVPGDNFFGPSGRLFFDDLNEIDLDGGFGGNIIAVQGTASGTILDVAAGQGNDLITIGGALIRGEVPIPATVKGIMSPVLIDGEDGNNTLVFNDKDEPTASVVTVRDNRIGMDLGDQFFGSKGNLHYNLIQHLFLFASAGGNLIKVVSTSPLTQQVGIIGGALDDTIDVGGLDAFGNVNVNQIHSDVQVHGQGGADAVDVNDSAAAAKTRITMTATQVGADAMDSLFPSGGRLTYDGLASLTVNAGSKKDTVLIRSTAAVTATQVNTGGGGDDININSNGDQGHGFVDGVAGPLTINGQGGHDALTLDDFNNAQPKQVSLTSQTIGIDPGDHFFGGGALMYNNIATLTVNLGQAGNAVFVRDTDKKTGVTINGGMSGDRFTVGSSTGLVDGIRSLVSINGMGGPDRLLVDDSGNNKNTRLTLAPGQIGVVSSDTYFAKGAGVLYTVIAQVAVKTGSGADIVNVQGQSPATLLNLNTNGGADTINVYVNVASNYNQLFINGGAPSGSLGDVIHLFFASSAIVSKHLTGPNNTGYLLVDFGNGLTSRIDFTDVESIS